MTNEITGYKDAGNPRMQVIRLVQLPGARVHFYTAYITAGYD